MVSCGSLQLSYASVFSCKRRGFAAAVPPDGRVARGQVFPTIRQWSAPFSYAAVAIS
ncbi:hypothetical protein QN061_15485 [Vibrio fluvialis]|uniref:hypothetical protein n=1 Tax=Vibrio fluvialis TaxID=676 RepID=UPI0024DF5A2C|nr:hypothetical protein [Vibrio fluvialis]WIE03234.1 hypothetical protein QN061_15485 [Vibrio fluvialis]